MSRLCRFLSSRDGHSVIEVMIGMTILAVTLSSAYALSVNNSTLFLGTQRIAAAVNLADYKMEELRNTAYDSIIDGYDGNPYSGQGAPMTPTGGSDGKYYRWWWVTNDDPEVGMKTVLIYVAWYERGRLRGYPLKGVIAE